MSRVVTMIVQGLAIPIAGDPVGATGTLPWRERNVAMPSPNRLFEEQADTPELALNMKTAETPGLTIPHSIALLAADIVQ